MFPLVLFPDPPPKRKKEGLGTRLFCSYALVRECLGMRLHSTLTWIALLSSLVVGFFFPCCPPSAPPPLPRPLPSRWNGFSPFCGDLGVFSSETTAAFMEGGFPLATPAPCWWSWSFFEELIQDLRLRSHASILTFAIIEKYLATGGRGSKLGHLRGWSSEQGKHVTAKQP